MFLYSSIHPYKFFKKRHKLHITHLEYRKDGACFVYFQVNNYMMNVLSPVRLLISISFFATSSLISASDHNEVSTPSLVNDGNGICAEQRLLQ
jgi:hypothetical protein